ARRNALQPAAEDLRRGDRQGRGEAARRALSAGDRARQPGDPPPRGDGELPRPALQPRGRRRRPGHGDPLLRDPRLGLALPDPDPELLRGAQRAAAAFALDGERGREAGAAGRALRAELALALRADCGKLGGGLLEVALGEPAAEADRDPVPERLAPLFLQPVAGAAHRFCSASRAIARAIPRRRSNRPSWSPERSSVYLSRTERNLRVKCPRSRSPVRMTKSYGIGTHSPYGTKSTTRRAIARTAFRSCATASSSSPGASTRHVERSSDLRK